MDHTAFLGLLTQVRKLLDVVRCFGHSEDKAAIIELIEKRLCAKVDSKCAVSILKSAAFSKDRLKILRALLNHLKDLTQEEAKSIVDSCFDSVRDKAAAWATLSERFEYSSISDEANPLCEQNGFNFEDAVPSLIFEYIENLAKGRAQRVSAFDLPLLDELSLLRKTIIDKRQAIDDEVEKRHRAGHHFVVPSRISAITRNLRPGRISAIADKDSKIVEAKASKSPEIEIIPVVDAYKTKAIRESNCGIQNRIIGNNAIGDNKIWNILNPAYTSPLAAYYVNKVGEVR